MLRGPLRLRRIFRSSPSMGPWSQRSLHWKASAPAPLRTEITQAQEKLPRLPVPDLPSTLAALKESLKPTAWSPEEYAAAVQNIDEFQQGLGPELQKRLEERQANTVHWLEEWWDNLAYLGYRDSVVINVSYYYGFDAHPAHLPQTPANRAASLARASMIFRRTLKQGLLKPDGTKEGPFCMDTYRWMFDCCRIPGPKGLDWSVTYAAEGDSGESPAHIIVFRKNRPWKVETAKNGRILSTAEIEEQIQYIYDNSKDLGPGVGVLSSNNRDVWAKDFTELSSSLHNQSILKDIFSAAFTISLDTATPTDPIPYSRDLWHGEVASGKAVGLENRWVDKPVEFIVFDNNNAGIMGEHSVMDGTPTVRLCDEVLDMLADPSFDHGDATSGLSKIQPTPLAWDISPSTKRAIESANTAAVELIETHDMSFYRTSYGKAAIKKFGVSPDSWAQMIVQLAYRRFLRGDKRIGGTYEAATTRKFFKGRTEVIRVVTSESDAWVASMDDQSLGSEERLKLFAAATKQHISMAKKSGNGLGVDRHLLGLKQLLKDGEELPAMFSDPVYKRSAYWVLSTSAIFSKHFPVYGWGEVTPEGFGVCYMTGFDDYLQYTLTSRKGVGNDRFSAEIAQAARDLYDLHAQANQKPRL